MLNEPIASLTNTSVDRVGHAFRTLKLLHEHRHDARHVLRVTLDGHGTAHSILTLAGEAALQVADNLEWHKPISPRHHDHLHGALTMRELAGTDFITVSGFDDDHALPLHIAEVIAGLNINATYWYSGVMTHHFADASKVQAMLDIRHDDQRAALDHEIARVASRSGAYHYRRPRNSLHKDIPGPLEWARPFNHDSDDGEQHVRIYDAVVHDHAGTAWRTHRLLTAVGATPISCHAVGDGHFSVLTFVVLAPDSVHEKIGDLWAAHHVEVPHPLYAQREPVPLGIATHAATIIGDPDLLGAFLKLSAKIGVNLHHISAGLYHCHAEVAPKIQIQAMAYAANASQLGQFSRGLSDMRRHHRCFASLVPIDDYEGAAVAAAIHPPLPSLKARRDAA